MKRILSIYFVWFITTLIAQTELIELSIPDDTIPEGERHLYKINVRKYYTEVEKIKKAQLLYSDYDYINMPIFSYEANKPFDVQIMDIEFKLMQADKQFEHSNLSLDELNKLLSVNIAQCGIKAYSAEGIKKVSEELFVKHKGADTDVVKFIFENISDIYMCYAEEVKNINVDMFKKWKSIYENPPSKVEKSSYKIPKGGRFMFEIRTPHTLKEYENIAQELDLFKKEGYIGVVFVWDGKDDYMNLVKAQKLAKEKGFRIWLSFSTCDYLSNSCFIDPELYEKGLSELSKNAEAFLMGWRRTSLHLQLKDEAWQNYTMQACRKGNPEIGFIGEYYYGYNGTNNVGEFHGYVDFKDNYNGIIVVNFGFLSVNPKDALRIVRASVNKDVDLVIIVWGEKTHYLTTSKNSIKQRTKPQYRRINRLIEKRFINMGFHAAIGCAGDGSNKGNGIDDMCFSDNHSNKTTKY